MVKQKPNTCENKVTEEEVEVDKRVREGGREIEREST